MKRSELLVRLEKAATDHKEGPWEIGRMLNIAEREHEPWYESIVEKLLDLGYKPETLSGYRKVDAAFPRGKDTFPNLSWSCYRKAAVDYLSDAQRNGILSVVAENNGGSKQVEELVQQERQRLGLSRPRTMSLSDAMDLVESVGTKIKERLPVELRRPVVNVIRSLAEELDDGSNLD